MMDINKTYDNNEITLALTGRLDTSTSPKLQEALIPEFDNAGQVILDFANLAYISSAGLRVLIMGEKTAKAKGGSQILINVSEEIMEIFEMTGFTDILHIRNS